MDVSVASLPLDVKKKASIGSGASWASRTARSTAVVAGASVDVGERQPGHLFGGRVGKSLPAVADVDVPHAAQAVDVTAAGAIDQVDPVAPFPEDRVGVIGGVVLRMQEVAAVSSSTGPVAASRTGIRTMIHGSSRLPPARPRLALPPRRDRPRSGPAPSARRPRVCGDGADDEQRQEDVGQQVQRIGRHRVEHRINGRSSSSTDTTETTTCRALSSPRLARKNARRPRPDCRTPGTRGWRWCRGSRCRRRAVRCRR